MSAEVEMPSGPMNRVTEQLLRSVLSDSTGLDDRELVGCFIENGDEAAFATIVKRHGPMVWSVCHRVLSNNQDTEDAFQATFLVLVRKASSIVSRELLGNWLYGVAYQTALHARRTIARRRVKEVQVTMLPDNVGKQGDSWVDIRPLLDQELSRLPEKYRVTIVLCDLEGRTRREVACQLGVPEGTVGGRLARARAMLAKRLTERGVALSSGTLAAVMAEHVASAEMPDGVMFSTISVARPLVTGKALGTEEIPVKVAALTEGVMKAMLFAKLKLASVLVFAALLVLGTIALPLWSATAQQKPTGDRADPKEPALAVQTEKPNEKADKEGSTGLIVVGPYHLGEWFGENKSWKDWVSELEEPARTGITKSVGECRLYVIDKRILTAKEPARFAMNDYPRVAVSGPLYHEWKGKGTRVVVQIALTAPLSDSADYTKEIPTRKLDVKITIKSAQENSRGRFESTETFIFGELTYDINGKQE